MLSEYIFVNITFSNNMESSTNGNSTSGNSTNIYITKYVNGVTYQLEISIPDTVQDRDDRLQEGLKMIQSFLNSMDIHKKEDSPKTNVNKISFTPNVVTPIPEDVKEELPPKKDDAKPASCGFVLQTPIKKSWFDVLGPDDLGIRFVHNGKQVYQILGNVSIQSFNDFVKWIPPNTDKLICMEKNIKTWEGIENLPPSVKHLDVTGCSLRSINGEKLSKTSITHLILKSNLISSMKGVELMPKLEYINVEGCDCQFSYNSIKDECGNDYVTLQKIKKYFL